MKRILSPMIFLILSACWLLSSCDKIMKALENPELFFSSSSSSYSGLIAEYHFKGNANDLSGNGNNGIMYPEMLTQDMFGNNSNALSFQIPDECVTVPNSPSLQLTTKATFSLWVNLTNHTPNGFRLIDKTTAGSSDGFLMDTYDGPTGSGDPKIRFLCGGFSAYSSSSYSLNTWHHLAVTFNSGLVNFYLDGKFDGTTVISAKTIPVNKLDLLIGGPHGGGDEFFQGLMDTVRIYNRDLTSNEMRSQYENDQIAVCYPFDSNANDTSGNGNNATIEGPETFTTGISKEAVNLKDSAVIIHLWGQDSKKWGQDEITIEFWAKPDSVYQSNKILFDFVRGASGNNYLRLSQWDPTHLQVSCLSASGAVLLEYNNDTNQFHHFAYSISKTDMSVYIDGTLAFSEAINPAYLNTSMPYEIILGDEWQATASTYKWSGSIDELKVMIYAKTAADFNTIN